MNMKDTIDITSLKEFRKGKYMNINEILRIFVVAIFTILIVRMPTIYADADFPLHGRISYDAESTLIKGADDDDWSRATLNTLVLTGDTLWTDKAGSTEIEFPEGVFLRMADASKVKVEQISPEIIFYGITGSFYIERVARSSGNVTFRTPACRITFDPNTCTRIDIGDGGATRVSTRWGKAYVTTDRGGNEMVSSGKRCWIDVEYLPSEVVSFATNEMDSFDRWNQGRSELLSAPVRTPPKYVEVTSKTIGYTELVDNGEWVLIEERYYWRPTVVVNYVPYRTGYWTYVPAIGSVWVETYPFGYITTHYGRWVYYETYGWVWGYDPIWSPAWVATVRCGDYFIWTPVDFYCRPVRVSTGVSFSVGGLDFYVSASTYAPATYVYRAPVYVAPVVPTVVNYVATNRPNISVWNITRYPSAPIRVPYQETLPTVRDYNPPRSIRGVSYYNDSGTLARSRVNELERSFSQRSSVRNLNMSANSPRSMVRTAMTNDRGNMFRDVKLNTTSPRAPSVRFSSENALLSKTGDMGNTSVRNIRGKDINTSFTQAVERTSSSTRDISGISSVRNTLNRGAERTNTARENLSIHKDVRGAISSSLDRTPKTMNSPTLSRLDMDGERKPRNYNPPSGGSTNPQRTSPKNDSGTGNRGITPRSTPSDRNSPTNRSTPRNSSQNWDRSLSDIRTTMNRIPERAGSSQKTAIPEIASRLSDNNARNNSNSITPSIPSHTYHQNINRSPLNGSSPSKGTSLFNSGGNSRNFSVPNRVSTPNPSTSIRPSIPSMPSFNHESSGVTQQNNLFSPRNSSSFSSPKLNTPSITTPSSPSLHRSPSISQGFSGGRPSFGGRGIR